MDGIGVRATRSSRVVTTLDALKKLDFITDLPAWGPFHDKALVTAFQNYLTDLTGR